MARRPLVAVAGCWAAGGAVLSVWEGWTALAVLAGMLLLSSACAYLGRMPPKLAILLGLSIALAAGERAWVEARNVSVLPSLLGDPDGRQVEASGRLVSPVDVDGDLATFRLRLSRLSEHPVVPKEKLLVRVRLAAEEEKRAAASWKRGDAVTVAGELRLPNEASNFGGFDYRSYLKRQGIHWTLSARGAASVAPLGEPVPWSAKPLRWIDEMRSRIGGLMDRLYGEEDAGYMKGLVAGIREDFDPQQFDAFASLGLTHILAISGLHVGVVVFLLLRLGAVFRLTRERSLDLTMAAMPVYMLLTGASPSAARACLMAMIALYLARRNRLKDGLHLLSASALIMLAWNPRLIEDVSFQLSFLVTAGLILLVPIASAYLPVRFKSLKSALAVAITAQICSLPVSIFYFHQFHFLSLPANLLLVPFISFVVLPLGMASVVLGALWGPLGAYAAQAATWCNRLTFDLTDRLQSAGFLQTYWPQPPLAWVASAYLLLGLTAVWLKSRQNRSEAARVMAERHADRLRRLEAFRFDPGIRAKRVRAYAETAFAAHEATRPLAAGHGEGLAQGGTRPFAAGHGEGLTQSGTQPLTPEDEAVKPTAPAPQGRRIGRLVAAILTVLWSLWLIWGLQPAWLDRTGKVMFLDVGQGDSILVRTGQGRFVLIDAGGTVSFRRADEAWRERRDPYEVGRKTLVPLLKQRGVRQLDALVLTHLDQDHIGGAFAVLQHFRVRALLFNGTLKPTAEAKRLFELALRSGVSLYAVHEGMRWAIDGTAQLEALYPAGAGGAGETIAVVDEQNERSVVLLLTLYGRRFLLPGDLEKAGETAIVTRQSERAASQAKANAADMGGIDVLKAGHHGSNTSTSAVWLMWWRPREAVISVGRNNVYGHPHPDVLERLRRAGTLCFRTDLNGEIQYRVRPDGRLDRRTKLAQAAVP
ncbi:ComEC/Rec2 family competence protein [Cohnella sp.]|uniref:ComEC/Rec2 family competence protein n=1 Tax=Cohnella sp. TaxID=1883426 RepID=UPI0025799A70|nr:ComEC/Rec2 family competence protein [Cohnella sp.]